MRGIGRVRRGAFVKRSSLCPNQRLVFSDGLVARRAHGHCGRRTSTTEERTSSACCACGRHRGLGWATASTTLLSLKSLCGGGVPSSHPSLELSVFFLFSAIEAAVFPSRRERFSIPRDRSGEPPWFACGGTNNLLSEHRERKSCSVFVMTPPNEHTSEGGRDDRGVPYHAESTLSRAQVLKCTRGSVCVSCWLCGRTLPPKDRQASQVFEKGVSEAARAGGRRSIRCRAHKRSRPVFRASSELARPS